MIAEIIMRDEHGQELAFTRDQQGDPTQWQATDATGEMLDEAVVGPELAHSEVKRCHTSTVLGLVARECYEPEFTS